MSSNGKLRVTEIFHSLQGEGRFVGWPTVFVRLTGCPLRCQYCDTAYAFHGGQSMSLDAILDAVARNPARHVTVTGGEPLAQPACLTLLSALCEKGYQVSLETSGALDIRSVDSRVSRVVDIKTPGSKESERNLWQNLLHLTFHDQVKFVICDREDYEWSSEIVARHRLHEQTEVFFSPSYQQLTAQQLADWILEDCQPVRMQLQIHKYLWGEVAGR